MGNIFYPEGSTELAAWVEELRTPLYQSGGAALVQPLRDRLALMSIHGPGTKRKRQGLNKLIDYLEPRLAMMEYPQRRAQTRYGTRSSPNCGRLRATGIDGSFHRNRS